MNIIDFPTIFNLPKYIYFVNNDFNSSIFSFFKKTPFELNQEIADISGKAQLVSSENTNLNDLLKLIDMSYQLYASICKKNDLEKVYEIGKNTLEVSEVQQSARTISTRDYLRIKGTFLSIQRQLASAEFEIQAAQKQFSTISNESFEKAKSLTKEKLKCDEDLKSLEKEYVNPDILHQPKVKVHKVEQRKIIDKNSQPIFSTEVESRSEEHTSDTPVTDTSRMPSSA